MKKNTLILILVCSNLWSQEYLNFDYLEEKNYINKFKNFDFSKIWIDSNNERGIYGVIGKNHQRLQIKFISVEKKEDNPNIYLVKGKTKVRNNIVDFKGIITIKKNLLSKNTQDYFGGIVKYQGVILANYKFVEQKKQNGSGIFKGKLYSDWIIMTETPNKVEYDSLEDAADGFNNNAFVGTWTSYRTKKEKLCNWGDSRVPLANSDFDIGAGELYPNEKYLKFGWEGYKAYVEQNLKAKEIEKEKWWEN